MFTLMTGVTGLREHQSEMYDQDPCSSFMMESAWPTWGVPLLPTYLSVCFSEPFDRLRKADGLSWWRSRFGFFKSRLGMRRAAYVWWRFGSYARHVVVVDHAVVVGHGQATSHPIRSRSIEQGASHRFRARLICIKWERERNSCSAVLPSPIGASFLNHYSLFFK